MKMRLSSISKALLVLVLMEVSIVATAQRAVPALWHRVVDDAKVLSQATLDELEAKLQQHDDSTSNEVAVLLIRSLEGDDLEEFSIRVAHNEWKLGKENKDNGVLLLIVVDDRRMRIEVGQGLEGALTDLESSRIIKERIAPYFREGNYDEGVKSGVDGILDAIQAEYTASAEAESEGPGLFALILLGILLAYFTYLAFIADGCVSWFMYIVLIPFYGAYGWAVNNNTGGKYFLFAFAIAFFVGRIIFSLTPYGKKVIKSNRLSGSGSSRSGGGKSSRSSSSSWSSGRSSSSSRGFSGGGGSFGGGGSSGSW